MSTTKIINSLLCYALTSVIVVLGVIFGHHFLGDHNDRRTVKGDLVMGFAREDGEWYRQIASKGYSYKTKGRSTCAFFPAYPLLASAVSRVTGLSTEMALLVVSHCCLAATFVLTAAYIDRRFGGAYPRLGSYVLLCLGLMPATLFFRMTYSESLFVFVTVWALFSMEMKWPLLLIALVVGLATATRPVGVALLGPLLLHCRDRSATKWNFVGNAAFILPFACWGIAAYILFQNVQFGEPLAFAKTQVHWGWRPVSAYEKFLALVTLEPIWTVFDSADPTYWGFRDLQHGPLFNWTAVNPIYFVLTVTLVLVGTYKRWLSSYEVFLSTGLLLIPYLTRGYEMGMGSGARFAAAVFPVYLVLGNILVRLPGSLSGALLGVSAFYLGAFSALFATLHLVY